MKKASLSLLSRFTRRNPNKLTLLLPGNYISTPTPNHLKPCVKTHALILNSRQFQSNPSPQPETRPPIPSRQRKILERCQLEEAFESAETTEQMLRIFGEMEACFDEKELGMAALKIGFKLDEEGEDLEKTLSFGVRALKVLDNGSDGKPSLPFAMALQLSGSASYSLNRFSDALGYLNRAKRVLGRLEEEGVSGFEDVRPVLHAVLLELANVKTALGRREEALENLRKCLEIKEVTLEKDSKELGVANRELAEAYVSVLNFKEALAFGLKALEIHKSGLGSNSVEVAHDRRVLGVIYSGLEEHEKALEQNELSKKVLKTWGLGSELLQAEIDASNMQIALGKFDEAINTLKGVVQQTEKDSETRALVFISMAKALSSQEKFSDAKRCLEIACGILEKKEAVSPVEASEAYSEIAMQYEAMSEIETAISLLKKTLSLIEKIPQEQHSEGSVSARLGWLLLLTGKVSQAIPYLESAAESLKDSFGPKHFGVGYIYNNLGAAYLELDRPQTAAQMFAVSKEIMDVALGPHHADSIEACQNLSKAYAAMKSYVLAIEFQQRAVDAWENHGPSAVDELKEARRVLEQLKIKARGASNDQLPPKALPLHFSVSAVGNSQPKVPSNLKQKGLV